MRGGEDRLQSLRNVHTPLSSLSRPNFLFTPLQLCNQNSMLRYKKYWKIIPPLAPQLTELDSQKVSKTKSILRYVIFRDMCFAPQMASFPVVFRKHFTSILFLFLTMFAMSSYVYVP